MPSWEQREIGMGSRSMLLLTAIQPRIAALKASDFLSVPEAEESFDPGVYMYWSKYIVRGSKDNPREPRVVPA